MKHCKKVMEGLDISSIKNKLLTHPEWFGQYSHRLHDAGPHKESSDIWVRYGDINLYGDKVFSIEHDAVWYPILKHIPECADIAFQLMTKVKGERLGGVLITRLEPGKQVYPHIDVDGWHPNYYDKYYVPISNEIGAVFGFEDGDLQGVEGDAYWFENHVPHWVVNNSNSVRIAMVICIKPFKGVE